MKLDAIVPSFCYLEIFVLHIMHSKNRPAGLYILARLNLIPNLLTDMDVILLFVAQPGQRRSLKTDF